jgi:tRNA dimethylallyltransferase
LRLLDGYAPRVTALPPRFPVIAGPTAGGKSDLAVDVALAFAASGTPGEVVSADSVQTYRGMDIGSGKPTIAERRGVPHHLIDIAEPGEPFTVSDWLDAARRAVEDVKGRGGVPVVVGGTHLYIKAFLEGLFEGPEPDPALREELRGLGAGRLRAELERVDPAAAARIHPNDERRTVRALEVYRQTGRPISEHQRQWDRGARADCVLVGLEWPAEVLARRINARVRAMMEAGLLEETRALWMGGRLGTQAREALGYRQLLEHLEGRCSLEEAVEQIKIETRRFAKQQRTWIRRLKAVPGSVWIDAAAAPRDIWASLVVRACEGAA